MVLVRTADFGSGDSCMTERPTDLSSLSSHRQTRGSLLSARKLALMASVVAGMEQGDLLTAAAYVSSLKP